MSRSRFSFARDLLAWYAQNKRVLPWRHTHEGAADPYRVWVSEVMLQQTTVPTVKPYFEQFMNKWSTIEELAAAPLDDILHSWQGLGYYSRARNLHACAQYVVGTHGGIFPRTKQELLKLPGIGPYTAAAIQAIAFNEHAVVVDGNVERIIARLYRMDGNKKAIHAKAASLTPAERWGEYAQAMMDLGSLVCTPRSPACAICPVSSHCLSYGKDPENFPPKLQKKEPKPIRHTTFYWITNGVGDVMIVKRPSRGLLGGMMGIPSAEWVPQAPTFASTRPMWSVQHTFSHFHLWGSVEVLRTPVDLPRLEPFEHSVWAPLNMLDAYAFPSLMQKVIRQAQEERQSA